MNHCPQCGASVDSDEVSCRGCGSPLAPDSSPSPDASFGTPPSFSEGAGTAGAGFGAPPPYPPGSSPPSGGYPPPGPSYPPPGYPPQGGYPPPGTPYPPGSYPPPGYPPPGYPPPGAQYDYPPPGGYPPPGWPYSPGGYGSTPGYPATGGLAGWGQRALGYLIDLGLLFVVLLPFYVLGLVSVAFRDLGTLAAIAVAVWFAIQVGQTGQSPGMRVMGLRCLGQATGLPIGGGLGFVRAIAHFVDSLICYVGWLFPLWDKQRQTLADKIMSTVVITVPKQRFSLRPPG